MKMHTYPRGVSIGGARILGERRVFGFEKQLKGCQARVPIAHLDTCKTAAKRTAVDMMHTWTKS